MCRHATLWGRYNLPSPAALLPSRLDISPVHLPTSTHFTTPTTADISYAALGLLPSIPLPTKPERNQRVKLPLLPPPVEETEAAPKIGFGRIVRDADGNVIDIIIDGEEEETEEDEATRKPLNPEEKPMEKVVAKTQVVRGELARGGRV